MQTFETLKYHRDERGVATVTLSRADKHNALDAKMIEELSYVAQQLDAHSDIRAVILAGEGKSFCAGGDLNWMRAQAEADRAGKISEAKKLALMLGAWNNLSKPVIARVHGAAYGGGVGLVAISDIVIATEAAKFGLTEVKLGLIPATISPFVVGRMGQGYARQVFFNAKGFDAEFAKRAGLIADFVQPDALDNAIEKEVFNILQCAPGAVADAKKMCLQLGGVDPVKMIDMTISALADRWETEEAQMGIKAFFDRSKPDWSQA